jgi:hypothetical protein
LGSAQVLDDLVEHDQVATQGATFFGAGLQRPKTAQDARRTRIALYGRGSIPFSAPVGNDGRAAGKVEAASVMRCEPWYESRPEV